MSDIKIEAIRQSRSFDQEKRSPTSLDRSKFEKLSNKGTLPPSRTQHAAASVEGALYILGGEVPIRDPKQDAQLLNDMYHYDIHHGLWSQVKQANAYESWPDKRKGHTLVVNKSQTALFLFGGMGTTAQASGRKSARGRPSLGKGGPQDNEEEAATGSDLIYYHDVWIFDLATKQWKEVKIDGDKPAGRAFHSAVCAGDEQMLIFGGFGCHEDNDVWSLSLSTMSWAKIEIQDQSPRPSRRWRHISALYGGNLYVFGGQLKSRVCDTAVWKLNLQASTWSRIDMPQSGASSNSPCARNDLAGCQFDNRWLIHGGNLGLTASTQKTTNLFHEFSFKSEKWRQLTPLFPTSPSLEGHQCTLLYEGPYVASIVLTNGGNVTGSPPHWPQSGWRLDFLAPTASHGLSNRIEEMYLHPFVRDTILSLWRDLKSRESNTLELMELKRKHSELLKEHMKITERHEGLSKNLEETSASLEATGASLRDVQAALADNQLVRERLAQQVLDLQSMVENLERQNEAKVHIIEELQRQAKEAEDARDKVKEELKWSREQNERRIDEFEREIENAREREADTVAHCESIERDLRRRAELLEDLNHKLTEAEENSQDLAQANHQLILDLESARALCKAAESNLEQVQVSFAEHVTQSTGEITQLQRTIDDLQDSLNSKGQEVKSLSASLNALETELSAMKQDAQHRLRDKDEVINRLAKEVDEYRKIETELTDRLRETEISEGGLKKKISNLEEDLASYQHRALEMQQGMQLLDEELQTLRQQKEDHAKELTQLRDTLKEIDDSLTEANVNLEKERKLHQATAMSLNQAVENCSVLKDSLKASQLAKEHLEAEKADLLAAKELLMTELDKARGEVEATKRELLSADAAKIELESCLASAQASFSKELEEANARMAGMDAVTQSLQREAMSNLDLIRRFQKYLEAGSSLKLHIDDILREDAPLSPGSTVDLSDFTP